MKDNSDSRRDFIRNAAGMLALAPLSAIPNLVSAEPKGSKKSDRKKLAVITGAARGMGRAFSVALAKTGVNIIGIDILEAVSPLIQYAPSNEQDMLETKRQVEATGASFAYYKADIRELDTLKEIAGKIKAEHGTIDILVADAGVQAFGLIVDSDTKHWKDILETNVIGTAHTLAAFSPLMIAGNKGKIVVIASTQGMRGMWNGAAYSASKWALVGLAKSAALELGTYHINVNVVVPGLINTEMTRNQKRWQIAMGPGYENKTVSEAEVSASLSKRDALGLPWLEAEDLAPAVVFLTSEAADKITGAVYDVAGGTSAIYTS